jgi:hypothetical protein
MFSTRNFFTLPNESKIHDNALCADTLAKEVPETLCLGIIWQKYVEVVESVLRFEIIKRLSQ